VSGSLRRIVVIGGYTQASVRTAAGVGTEPMRVVLSLDRFAAGLTRFSAAEVSVVDAPDLSPPAEGTMYLGDASVVRWLLAEGQVDRELAPRLVRLQLPPGGAMAYLAATGIAAAVDPGELLRWRSDPLGAGAAVILGRVEAAAGLDGIASSVDGDYCLLRAASRPSLPALLAGYLEVYVGLLEGGRLTR
jgi:hypothetical protein